MNINYITHLFILIFCLINNFTFCNQIQKFVTQANFCEKDIQEYYSYLKSINTLSTDDQIISLQKFLENHPNFDRVYLKLLEFYVFQNKIPVAKMYFEKLSAKTKFYHHSQWILGNISALNNNPDDSYKKYFKALTNNQPSILLIKDFITFHHKQSGKRKKSINLTGFISNPDKLKFALALSKRKKSDYKNAIQLFSSISSNYNHHPEILHNWGSCLYLLEQNNKADSIWSIGLKLSQGANDFDYVSQFLIDKAIIENEKNNYQRTLAYYDSANSILSLTGNKYLLQLLKGNIANFYKNKIVNYTKAATLYQEALEISKRIGIPRITCSWYLGYATSLFSLGRFNEAFEAYEAAERTAIKAKNSLRLVLILLDKGSDYYYLRQNALAKQTFIKALEIAKEKKIEYYYHYAKAKLGNIFLKEGNHYKAREYFRAFINYLDSNNRSNRSYSWKARLARSYLIEKRYKLAQKEYDDAFKIAKDAKSKSYMGWCMLYSGDIDLLFSNVEVALQKFKSVREIAEKQNINEMLWQVYLSYGNAFKKIERFEEAISAYRKAAEIFETGRNNLGVDQLRIGYSSEGYEIYQNLVHCFFERYRSEKNTNDLDSLFYYLQLSRGRSLNDLLLKGNSRTYPVEYQNACVNLSNTQRKLRNESNNLKLSKKWEGLHAKLQSARYSLIVQRLRSKIDIQKDNQDNESNFLAIKTIQEKLRLADLGLLIFHISDELSFVLVLNGQKAIIIPLNINLPDIFSSIDSLLGPFHNVTDSIKNIVFNADIANRLYINLFKPVHKEIEHLNRLVVIPDYALMNLPFEMLLTKSSKKSNYTPLDYPDYSENFLGNQFMFSYYSSISLIDKMMKPSSKFPKILAFANPIVNKNIRNREAMLRSKIEWRFDPLPYAEIEVNKIKDIWPQTEINKREAATENCLKNNITNHKILHFATHAFIDSSFNFFSGLVLNPGSDSTEDGLLMGYEIADLKLNSDLVTLSACETGRGKNVIGEGIIGLPRLFLAAGVNSVLMTHWKVEDKFTATLMTEFYNNYLKHNSLKIEALNNAKKIIILNTKAIDGVYYQHPFFWASFVLYGNPGISKSSSLVFNHYFIIILIMIIIVFFIIKIKQKGYHYEK